MPHADGGHSSRQCRLRCLRPHGEAEGGRPEVGALGTGMDVGHVLLGGTVHRQFQYQGSQLTQTIDHAIKSIHSKIQQSVHG